MILFLSQIYGHTIIIRNLDLHKLEISYFFFSFIEWYICFARSEADSRVCIIHDRFLSRSWVQNQNINISSNRTLVSALHIRCSSQALLTPISRTGRCEFLMQRIFLGIGRSSRLCLRPFIRPIQSIRQIWIKLKANIFRVYISSACNLCFGNCT